MATYNCHGDSYAYSSKPTSYATPVIVAMTVSRQFCLQSDWRSKRQTNHRQQLFCDRVLAGPLKLTTTSQTQSAACSAAGVDTIGATAALTLYLLTSTAKELISFFCCLAFYYPCTWRRCIDALLRVHLRTITASKCSLTTRRQHRRSQGAGWERRRTDLVAFGRF